MRRGETLEPRILQQTRPRYDIASSSRSGASLADKRLTVCCVCSHGGHLTEMLELMEAFEGHDVFFFCYDAETTRALPRAYRVPNRPRNPLEFFLNLIRAYRIFRKERPDMVVSTGAEIAIPVVLVAKWFRLAMVYIECGAQVTTSSLTGRLMYWLADRFYVQWPELLRAYGPRAMFRGSLVDQDKPFEGDHSAEKRMRVTLLQPTYVSGFSSDQPPTGLAYLASVLQQEGCEVRVIDASVERLTVEQTARRIEAQHPDIVGVTVTTPLLPGALAVVRRLRADMPEPPIFVAGGPHPTVAPEDLLGSGVFDYVVRNEGEETLREFVRCLFEDKPLDNIQGLSRREGNEIIHHPRRELCDDLRDFPWPDWSLFPLYKYSSLARKHDFSLSILTSRGCPYNCTFCYKGVYGNRLRMREPEDVVDEWQMLIERYRPHEIAVIDDNFTMWPARAAEICELLVKRGLHTVPWSTTNGIRVNTAYPEVLKVMKEAGCYRVYFGIESGVQRVLDALNKRITVDQAREAVANARKAGLEVGAYFMLGNVGETPEDMDTTIDFAMSLDLDIIQYTIATPYPGTQMYRQIEEDGRFLFKSWEDLGSYSRLTFEMGELNPEVVGKKYSKALRRFYFNPRFLWRQLRQAFTWTGFKHRVLGAWLIVRLIWAGNTGKSEGTSANG
ncbi:MAG: PssD/Cps14F family polysaccharide biosynthesis glycosyltransferase [Candidatus Hydrogenedentes bacterium]|nr:PssD/Cps14F family polysaccharide biosynthesis glycosyltransferase [Candidatus Hydrogenedentota bacterium]